MSHSLATTTIDGDYKGRVVLTCEHAGKDLPHPWSWPDEDAWLRTTHWACDIGAAAFTRRLARSLGAPAVLSKFSRLLVDPNRPLDSDTLFRKEAEGRPIAFNKSLNEEERQRRIGGFYRPYHEAVSAMVEQSRAEIVFGVHTFTPHYEGNSRSLELGVLFDHDEVLAGDLVDHLRGAGFVTAPNEPYSGKNGLAYSPVLHAREFERRALEIEARQDLIVEESFARRLAAALEGFFG